MIIEQYLLDNNISKYQFAKECDLPYGTLNDICNGKTDIAKCTGETLLKISSGIGCSVDALLKERLGKKVMTIEKIKQIVRPIGRKYKLNSIYVFGSYARNEATEESDVDILIDREGSLLHGIFGISALLDELKQAFGKNVDLVTLQSLNQESTARNNPEFVQRVMKEKVKVYG